MGFDPAWVIQFATAALVGIVGWEAIRRFFVRARVYRDLRFWDLVRGADVTRRKEAETALVGRGLPTSILELEWWNAGRRGSKKIIVDVQVPGQIVDHNVMPGPDHVLAGWKMEEEPHAPSHLNHLRLSQDRLMPGVLTKLTIGYQGADEADEPKVRILEDDREVGGENHMTLVFFLSVLAALWFVFGFTRFGVYIQGDPSVGGFTKILYFLLVYLIPVWLMVYAGVELPKKTSKPEEN